MFFPSSETVRDVCEEHRALQGGSAWPAFPHCFLSREQRGGTPMPSPSCSNPAAESLRQRWKNPHQFLCSRKERQNSMSGGRKSRDTWALWTEEEHKYHVSDAGLMLGVGLRQIRQPVLRRFLSSWGQLRWDHQTRSLDCSSRLQSSFRTSAPFIHLVKKRLVSFLGVQVLT